MIMVPRPKPVVLESYGIDLDNPKRFYGLPKEVLFCKKCTYSNQKPNSAREFEHKANTQKETVELDNRGVCIACQIAAHKEQIDWGAREKALMALCDKYRRNDGRYDCIVPGSGGKDSFYAAYKLKYEYGMNPLTVTWAPHIYTDWGWKNFQAWMHAGFDNYLFTPNGRVHRLLTRLALETLLHPFQPFILGQMYFPPKIAAELNIPLVFYGENPSEYGNPIKNYGSFSKDMSYFSAENEENIYISGHSIRSLMENFGLKSVDLEPYLPAKKSEIIQKKIDVQYLGYYLKWHPQECYYFSVENGGFKAAPERSAGTYSKYSSIDDKVDDLHYYSTFIKFGIGRATYDTAQEIRNGELERDEGIALVKRFDGEYSDRFEKENFEYLSLNKKQFPSVEKLFEQPTIDKEYFDLLVDKFRSPHLWYKDSRGWHLRNAIYKTTGFGLQHEA